MKSAVIILIVCAAVAALTFTLTKTHQTRPNVILISIDTLRADHLSSYGYYRPTPHIDEFANDAVRFENAVSQAPWTTASHMSVFTSLYPTVHRVTHEALSDVQSTIPVTLQQSGYDTAAFVEATALDPRYGFKRGFNVYERKSANPSAAANNERVFNWLHQRNSSKPFFLFVHYYDVHRKYDPPAPYDETYSPSQKDLDSLIVGPYGRRKPLTTQQLYDIVALYDGEVRYVDDQIHNLMQYLKNHGLYRDSMIVLMADHGEGFLDHSLMDHGNSLYQELVHVPLIMKMPGDRYAGLHPKDHVRLIDILPTVLDYLHLSTGSLVQGSSLLPLIRGISKTEAALSSGAVGSESIVFGDWKLIHNNELEKRLQQVPLALKAEYELYNLESDPQEHNNLTDRDSQKRQELLKLLENQRQINDRLSEQIHTNHKPLDHEMEEQLKSLGYLQ